MTSVSGGQFQISANGEKINVVTTPDGSHLPPPISGEFNLEVVTSPGGSSDLPTGYQGVALLSDGGSTIEMASGDYAVRVTGDGFHTVIAWNGNDTVYGGNGSDSILGGRGSDLIYGGKGDDTIRAGTGPETTR